MDQLGNLGQLAAGLLDGLDVGSGLGQAEDGFGIEVDGGAAGHVVEGDGEGVNGFSEGQKVLELALLGGLVVVGIGGEHGVDAAHLAEAAGEAQQRARGVVGAAGPHRHTAGRGLGYDAQRQQPFLFVQRGRLACGPAGHQKVDAGVDLPVHQRPERRFIDRSIRPKGRNDSCTATRGFHDR